MRHPLEAQFVLDLHGQLSEDFYTVCGKCAGSVGDPAQKTWRCGEGVRKGVDGRAVTVFNLYKHCSLHWKWRNLNQTEDGGYEPPNKGDDSNDNDNDRVFNIGDVGCPEGKIKTVFTKWGEMATDLGTRINHGNCSSIIIPKFENEALAIAPTDQTQTTKYSTQSISSRSATTETKQYQGETSSVYREVHQTTGIRVASVAPSALRN